MKKAALIGLVVVLVLAALLGFNCSNEPRYQGRTLTSWLEQSSAASLMETQQLAEAQEAIRAIGAGKALPRLLKLIKTTDNPALVWLAAQNEELAMRFFHWRPASDFQLQGIAGFEALGTNTAPAVGELTRLLENKELAFVAARCLENAGKSAESALCRGLTNQDWQVRHLSVSALTSVTDDVEVYLGRIKDRLKDAEASVRFATVQAIGAQDNAPELAVPFLIQALGDADDNVCDQAGIALSGFGTNAVGAFSTLTNLVTTGRQGQARAALRALPAISPAAALPVLSNAVVNGSAGTLDAALKGLKSIAPELALKMTLAEFHSPDPTRRAVAIGLAADYDPVIPGIADALKSVANDPDPELARHSVMTMRGMLNKKRGKSDPVQIPGEPSYQGKPLGEWLKMRNADWMLSTNAVEALVEMGTNVIPALLTRVGYRDPTFNLYDYEVSMEAVRALISLRELAKPALPALADLMDSHDEDLALRAMVATAGTGADTIPFFMKGLTNQSPKVRSQAASYLTGEWSAQFPEQRRQAIPLLVKLLSDPNEAVRASAANTLKELDPQAAANSGVR